MPGLYLAAFALSEEFDTRFHPPFDQGAHTRGVVETGERQAVPLRIILRISGNT